MCLICNFTITLATDRAHVHVQALESAREKDALAQAAAADAAQLQQRVKVLSAEVDELSQEAAELRADAETRGAAVDGLHATLERIERATSTADGHGSEPPLLPLLPG